MLWAAMILLSASCLFAQGLREWPLRNGAFRSPQGHGRAGELAGLPNGWSLHSESGQHKAAMGPSEFLHRAGAIVSTIEAGHAVLAQEVFLLAGDYRLVVEVMEEGYSRRSGDIELSVTAAGERLAGQRVRVGNSWAQLTLDVSVPTGKASVGLGCIAPAGNAVKFRSAQLTVKRLHSSPAPLADGRQVGAVILPANASLAEEYACYELQRYVHRMTGAMPGLQGRDAVCDGVRIRLGASADAAIVRKLEGLATDSYVTQIAESEITLAGNTARGTLYAIYDFLAQQGCRWVMPGELGEVVPKRESLSRPKSKTESPDYQCRGFMVMLQDFYPTGGQGSWRFIDFDAYYDWFLRNRLNGFWGGGTQSHDMGAHRGHSWVQVLNHSYNAIIAPQDEYFKDHPEWYPLVNGKRIPVCNLGPQFNNQLCVSNQSLRDYTVELVVAYFKDHPETVAFPLSPMDGPSFWCECDECKALDPPGIDWSEHVSKGHVTGMADRALNYANEVAQRVSDVFPDKLIEMYAYGYTLDAPVREKAHPNVIIKYANLSGGRGTGPLGESIMAQDVSIWQQWRETLDGWNRAEAQLAFYNYLEWEHPDVSLFWFYNTADTLKHLNREYNFRALLGETENNQYVSVMLYNILARTVWDVDTDYREVVRDVCDRFYGRVADEMFDYNMMMSDAIDKSTEWQKPGWRPNEHLDLSLDVLAAGQQVLDRAWAKAAGDAMLARRLARAGFGHACLTYVRTLSEKDKTYASADAARTAFDMANRLRGEHDIMVKLTTVPLLEKFFYPQVTGRVVLSLPDVWDFKKDPQDVGVGEQWFKKRIDASWQKIRITQDWTAQPVGMGYHGVGWYRTRFSLPPECAEGNALVIYFGAVDGYADVYLDGREIGGQRADVGLMWDKPFTVSLPGDIDLGRPHDLVVRVRKDSFAAGIWKPVNIALGIPRSGQERVVQEHGGRIDW